MFFGGDPFEHFGAGMGGPRGHRGEVDNEEFYNILGVSKDASDSDIKKVGMDYRRQYPSFWLVTLSAFNVF